ncbi:protein argonaute-2-like, partial [Stylophora pistillata]|uniref:protein argonaute-2-like n=1 Tax=Stylophora pistillata TaxID=50429 RepID=UPI000C050492
MVIPAEEVQRQGKGKNKRKGKGRGNAGRGRGRGQDPTPTPGRTEHVGKPPEESGITTEEKPDYSNPKDSSTADFDEKRAAGACGNDLTNGYDEDTGRQEKSSATTYEATTTVEEHNQRGNSSGETPSKSKKIKGRQRDIPASPPDDKGEASTLLRGATAADASSTKSVSATTPTSATVTSSSAALNREVENLTKKLGSSLGSGGHTTRQTQGNGGPRPPKRPGYGTKGRPIPLRANFFRLNVSPGLSDLYHYDVEITPERCPKRVKRDVVNEIINKYKKTTFQGHHPAFDGEKNLYSRIKLPVSAELEVKLPGEDGGRDRVFKVKIQLAATVSLLELNNFLSGKQNGKIPQDAVQALDIVVRQMLSMSYTPVGRSFFPFDGQGRPLGEGCEVKFGFYSSIRHSEWKAMLVNIDVSAKGFYKDQAVVPDFLCETLDVKPYNLEDHRFEPDRRRLEKAIRGIRIQTTHAAPIKRKYAVWGVSAKSADRMQFDVTDEGTCRTYKTTVAEYFKDRYRLTLRYPHLPCLLVGPKKDRYLPMEVCTIVPCQRKHLSEQQTANMIRSTARPAPERQRDIQHWVQEMTRTSSKYLKDEFQTSISTEMVKVEGRVLPAPRINLGPQDQSLVPRDGSWDMRNKSLHDGARIDKWALACFCGRCREEQLRNFSRQMASISSRQGLRMSEQPVVVAYGRGARDVESLFSKWVVDFPGLQLIIAVLPERDKQIYPELKRVGDNVIGIPTQGVQSKNVHRCNPQLCANLALKINSK